MWVTVSEGAIPSPGSDVDDLASITRTCRGPQWPDVGLSFPILPNPFLGNHRGGVSEVVRDGGRRELAAVELGLFDTGNGRVEVTGAVEAGARVVVPSS